MAAKKLSVDYLPMTEKTLCPSERFGPVEFKISERSHHNHLSFLRRALGSTWQPADNLLFPFETWPLARVLSSSRFGRLNETLLASAYRVIFRKPSVDEQLIGFARLEKMSKINGICFARFSSRLEASNGRVYMNCSDTAVLLRSCDQEALRGAIKRSSRKKADEEVRQGQYLRWEIDMRWEWRADEWRNNIHTGRYAKALGYQQALTEGPGLVDIILAADKRDTHSQLKLSWKHPSPAYAGLKVFASRQGEAEVICREKDLSTLLVLKRSDL